MMQLGFPLRLPISHKQINNTTTSQNYTILSLDLELVLAVFLGELVVSVWTSLLNCTLLGVPKLRPCPLPSWSTVTVVRREEALTRSYSMSATGGGYGHKCNKTWLHGLGINCISKMNVINYKARLVTLRYMTDRNNNKKYIIYV